LFEIPDDVLRSIISTWELKCVAGKCFGCLESCSGRSNFDLWLSRKPECTRTTIFTQLHSDPANPDFRWKHSFSLFTSQRERRDETPRTIHIQPKQKSALAMKSELIKRADDGSCMTQRRRSSVSTSIERERHDEIGSRRRAIWSASDQIAHAAQAP